MKLNSNPFFLMGMMFSIGSGLYYAFNAFPFLAVVVLAVSSLILFYRYRKSKESDSSSKILKNKVKDLQQLNIARYAPWLKENVRGHNMIIDMVLLQLQQNLFLANEKRTLGAYFFVGPTGTGKTFLAELIGQALFKDSKPLILRMNQYKLPSDVLTLLGPPPGHEQSDVGGALTRPVLEDPYRVVILDEIDKCHPDVLDCLYNIIDTAQCAEKSSGKTVNFSRCVFFATSNVAVDELRKVDLRGKGYAYMHSKYRETLAEHSSLGRPFLARWDGVFFMDTLNPVTIAEVACLQIRRHWKQFDMDVVYTSPELLVQTVTKNHEFREFGVRQLSNYIKMTTDPVISQAKVRGFKRVKLEIDEKSRQIVVKVAI